MAEEIGSLRVGRGADVSVLSILEGGFSLSDNSGETVRAAQLIAPEFCLREGEYFAADSALVPPAIAA
jgi:dihydroorotase